MNKPRIYVCPTCGKSAITYDGRNTETCDVCKHWSAAPRTGYICPKCRRPPLTDGTRYADGCPICQDGTAYPGKPEMTAPLWAAMHQIIADLDDNGVRLLHDVLILPDQHFQRTIARMSPNDPVIGIVRRFALATLGEALNVHLYHRDREGAGSRG